MKKIFFIIILISLLFLIACNSEQPEKIAIMNMQEVVENSNRAQAMHRELLEIGSKLEVEYDEKKGEKSADQSKEELDKIYQKYIEHKYYLEHGLNQAINKIVGEIASQEGIDIVLLEEGVYFGGIDISSQVIDKLDQIDGEE